MLTIKASTVRGASWTIAAGAVTRALGLVASVVITHYVAPAALGEAAAASIFVLTAQTLTSLGMGQYLIATQDKGRANTFHITVLNFAGVALSVLVVLAVRAPLSAFLNVAGGARYVPLLLAGFVVDRIGFIPERLLLRQLRFRRIAAARSSGDFVYTVVSIGLAMAGWGAFAIVWASVARSVLKMLAMTSSVALADWLTPAPLEKTTYKRIFHYGLPIAGQGILTSMSSRWDNLLFSYLFGAAPMARYNVAYNLADIPADQVGEQIAEVLLPSFAEMQPAERDRAVIEAAGLTALIIFPLSIGLGAVAPTLVRTILSPEWREVGGMLSILAALSVARPLAWQANAYLLTVSATRTGLVIEIIKLVLLFTFMSTLARLGQLWACVAVGLAFGGALFVAWWIIARRTHGHVWSFVAECLPALAACGVMVLAVLATRWAFARTGIELRGVGLALEIVAGGVGYLAALPIVARQTSKKLLTLIREGRRGKAAKSA